MAIYHLHSKVIKRSEGKSSVAASAYRSAEKITDDRTGIIHDYTNKSQVNDSYILLPHDAPEEYKNRDILWNTVEKKENRKDAQVCREIEVSLPVELDKGRQKKLINKYVESEFVSQGMIADIAFHKLDSSNPHAHILLTMREVGSSGFGKKNRDWNKKERLTEWREKWALECNNELYAAGSKSRISHKTLKEQGVKREPTKHLGKKKSILLKGGVVDSCLKEAIAYLRKELKSVQSAINLIIKPNAKHKRQLNHKENRSYFAPK